MLAILVATPPLYFLYSIHAGNTAADTARSMHESAYITTTTLYTTTENERDTMTRSIRPVLREDNYNTSSDALVPVGYGYDNRDRYGYGQGCVGSK